MLKISINNDSLVATLKIEGKLGWSAIEANDNVSWAVCGNELNAK